MIARPPEKNPNSKKKPFSPFSSPFANDNHPPNKTLLGWGLLMAGAILLVGAFISI